jgi:hypothetical protein
MPCYIKDRSSIAPQMILLHFNDCMYITYRCLTLGFEFQDRMPFERKELCIFIDMVYLFKDIAESWLREHIVSSLRSPSNFPSCIKCSSYSQRQPNRRDWMSYLLGYQISLTSANRQNKRLSRPRYINLSAILNRWPDYGLLYYHPLFFIDHLVF